MKLTSTVAARAGRYNVTTTANVCADDGRVIGRAGMGTDKSGGALVFETGQSQTGVPVAALVAVITNPACIPHADLVAAFAEAGTLDGLAAAVAKAVEARKK